MRRRAKRSATVAHRLAWQGSALLLARPDGQFFDRVHLVAEMLGHLDGPVAMPLGRAIAGLQQQSLMAVTRAHDDVFGPNIDRDLRLTTWIAGTTREQVGHVLEFTSAYRAAGVERPRGEAHDHLAVLLEFAAHVDPEAGGRLLAEYRVPVAAMARTLADAGSPFAHVLTAVGATLPEVTAQQVDELLRSVQDMPDESKRHAPNGL